MLRRNVLGGGGALLASVILGGKRAQAAEPGNLAALVIGVDRYTQLRPLERAVADARSVASAIGTFGYRAVVLENATSAELLEGLDRFLAMLTPQTSAFVFAACHGIQVGGQNYILPADADGSDAELLLESALQAGELLGAIARRQPQQCIAMFDACRNDPLTVAVPGAGRGFASINAPGGFYIAYSAGEGQFALDKLGDADPSKNGVFARYLVEQMDPETLIDDIVKNVREEVISAAQGIGHSQCPAIYDQSGRDLRLDGQITVARRRVKTKPRLDGAGVLIVACQDYDRYSPLSKLVTPAVDARRLARDFERMGATVVTLLDPTRNELLAACQEMAAQGHTRRFLYLSGQGGAQSGDAWMFIPAVPREQWTAQPQVNSRSVAASPVEAPLYLGQATLISVSEIVASLASPVVAANQDKPDTTRSFAISLGKTRTNSPTGPAVTRLPRNAHLFCDFCLTPLELPAEWMKSLEARTTLSQRGLLSRWQSPSYGGQELPGVSLLFASSPEQAALDAAPGQSGSPFALAISNALGQPGLSVAQFADRVRTTVETLTKRFQTPMLYCDEETQDQVLIDSI